MEDGLEVEGVDQEVFEVFSPSGRQLEGTTADSVDGYYERCASSGNSVRRDDDAIGVGGKSESDLISHTPCRRPPFFPARSFQHDMSTSNLGRGFCRSRMGRASSRRELARCTTRRTATNGGSKTIRDGFVFNQPPRRLFSSFVR